MSKLFILSSFIKCLLRLLKSGSVVAQIGHTGLGMLVFQIMAFLSSILVARWLGPVGQGKFQLAISITVVGVGLVKLGLDEGLAYLLPQYQVQQPDKLSSLIAYALIVSLTASTLAGAILAGFADVMEQRILLLPGISTDLRFTLALFPSMMLMLMGMAVLRGLGRSDLRAYIYYYGVGGSFLFLLFGIVSTADVVGVYVARILSFGLGAVFCLVCIIQSVPIKKWSLSRADLYNLHGFSGLLIFVSFFQYLVEQPLIDLIIIGRIASADVVGVYSVATRLSVLVSLVPSMMMVVMAAPFAKGAAEHNRSGVKRQYYIVAKWMSRLNLLAAGIIFILREPLLALFGKAYQAGEIFLFIFLVGHVLVGLTGLNTPILLAYHQTKLEFLLTGSAALLMLVASLLLGIWWGPIGVALATASILSFLAIARRIAVARILQIGKLRLEWQTVVTGSISFAVAVGIQTLLPEGWWAILPASLFAAFFGGLILVTSTEGLGQGQYWQNKLQALKELR